jgi:hypothetical protein
MTTLTLAQALDRAQRGQALPRARVTKADLETIIARWDRRQRNHHAGALALLALDEAWEASSYGKGAEALSLLLPRYFNDRLLDMLMKAAAGI